jgi:hypothetical protein
MSSFNSVNLRDFTSPKTAKIKFKMGDKTAANTDINEPRNDPQSLINAIVYGAVVVKKLDITQAWAFKMHQGAILYHPPASMKTIFSQCSGDIDIFASRIIEGGYYALSHDMGPHVKGPITWMDIRKPRDLVPITPKPAGGNAKSMMPSPSSKKRPIDVDDEGEEGGGASRKKGGDSDSGLSSDAESGSESDSDGEETPRKENGVTTTTTTTDAGII